MRKLLSTLHPSELGGVGVPFPTIFGLPRAAAGSLMRGMVPVLLILGVWQATAMGVALFRGVTFPTPLDTGERLIGLLLGGRLTDYTLYRHFIDSLWRWFVGFAGATVFGIGVGLFAALSRTIRDGVYPALYVLQLIPGLAWIPVAILIFGVGESATIFMIAITSFTPVAINLIDGIRHVDTTFVRAAQMLGAGRRALIFRVLLPGALPTLVSGLRIGLGNGWRVLVAGEMIVGSGTGLGYSIIQARWTLDYSAAFSCIVVICFIGLVFEKVVFRRLEEMTIQRWCLKRDQA